MDNMRAAFTDFCRSTSLHGWHHLTENPRNNTGIASNGSRFVWVCIVFASVGVATFFLFTSVNDFSNKHVATSIDTTTASLHVCMNWFSGPCKIHWRLYPSNALPCLTWLIIYLLLGCVLSISYRMQYKPNQKIFCSWAGTPWIWWYWFTISSILFGNWKKFNFPGTRHHFQTGNFWGNGVS